MNRILKMAWAVLPAFLISCGQQEVIRVCYDTHSPVLSYGIGKLSRQMEDAGYTMKACDADSPSGDIFILTAGSPAGALQKGFLADHISGVASDGFKIVREHGKIYILGSTERGCLYGIMELMEQLGQTKQLAAVKEKQVNPAISFRAIKFNLPWSPYRPGPATGTHLETCRDLDFWESFLDMMVENRFNALSLWNTHPFPTMIRATNFPEATALKNLELDQWQSFWRSLFRMAKIRGIETYMVNWNIVVSPEFASAYGADEYFDRSELVKRYTRESVTQLINEYEDLTGLGVTLADWMGNWGDQRMTSAEREKWIEETFVEGMAKADRKVKFIHRAVLAGDPVEMRGVIDRAELPHKTIVEVKFNWSHGHSTPYLSLTHSNDDGTIMKDFWDPLPENYFIAWMIRNEDFFVLRWGDPGFIRDHIKINSHEYVDGYFIGSEGYIPAKDYSHKVPHPHKTWKYAFEKQWLYYHLWGRLIYDPTVTDETLSSGFQKRYKNVDASVLLEAHSLASKVPLSIASFYKATWDFTLYSEGFMSAWPIGFDDRKSPFISIQELINHETLDARYLDIRNYCTMMDRGLPVAEPLIDPLELAEEVQEHCQKAMTIVENIRSAENESGLDSELDDIETWCCLGYYFADKLRAGVSVEFFNLTGQPEKKEEALAYLENCFVHWEKIVEMTIDRYNPMPYVSMGHHEPRWPEFTSFHWSRFLEEVEADITYVKNLSNENPKTY